MEKMEKGESRIFTDKHGNSVKETEYNVENMLLTFTTREYPVNTWVLVEDNRENMSSGEDLEDCYIVPARLVGKYPNTEFCKETLEEIVESYLN